MSTFAMVDETSTGTKATLPILKWKTRPLPLPAQAIGGFSTFALPGQRSFPVH